MNYATRVIKKYVNQKHVEDVYRPNGVFSRYFISTRPVDGGIK